MNTLFQKSRSVSLLSLSHTPSCYHYYQYHRTYKSLARAAMDIHSHQVSLRRGVPLEKISSLEFVDRGNTVQDPTLVSWAQVELDKSRLTSSLVTPGLASGLSSNHLTSDNLFDWCCFQYFVRNSLVALLEALCAQAWVFSLDSWISVFLWHFFFGCCKVSNKAFFAPLSTRLLCLVVSIPLVCWLYLCACVCVPLYVHVKMCR